MNQVTDPPGQTPTAPGYRLTRRRRLVLQILHENPGHLDADTIWQRARAADSSISLATVYRALDFLKQAGLVSEHTWGEGHGHFEPVQASPHYHFVCERCGQVIEFVAPEVMDIRRKLAETRGLLITSAHLFFGGYCPACRQDAAHPSQRLQRNP